MSKSYYKKVIPFRNLALTTSENVWNRHRVIEELVKRDELIEEMMEVCRDALKNYKVSDDCAKAEEIALYYINEIARTQSIFTKYKEIKEKEI